MGLTEGGEFEGFGGSGAAGTPCDVDEEGTEAFGHPFEAGMEVLQALFGGQDLIKGPSGSKERSDGVGERHTAGVFGGKNSREK